MIVIPQLGQLEEDDEFDNWLRSDPISVNVLGGGEFVFTLEDYMEDEKKEEFHQAIENILSVNETILKQAQDNIYRYYTDANRHDEPGDSWYVEIGSPEEVWNHIQFMDVITVKRRPYRDELIYIDVECGCNWEQEHGLQIVFKQGLSVNKVGPYDGHLTNSDAYGKQELENVVYHSV